MKQTRIGIDNFFTYEGLYPTTLKKVDQTDVSINSFQVYKKWTFVSGSATSSALPLTAIYTNTIPTLQTELSYNDASNIDGSLQTVIYYSLNHLFYRYKDDPFKSYGPTNLAKTKKVLFESASVLSIPQIKIGERIKNASFSFTSSVSGSFASDSYENIYDISFNTSSIISDVMYYEGFNEYFDTSKIAYNSPGITYVPGVTTTTGQQKSIGYSAQFNGSAFIETELPGYYDRYHDFAISFFISGANSNTQHLIGKRTDTTRTQFPFEIFNVNNQIRFNGMQLNLSASLSASWTHIVCQKTGSYMQIYKDGSLITSSINPAYVVSTHPLSASIRIDNDDLLKIGGYSNSSSFGFTGKLDEIRIYNKALTATQVGYLSDRTEGGTLLQTRNVGTVFPNHGIIVFSSADYRFKNLLKTPFTASYRSTKTIHELNSVVRIAAGEFNLSTNVTLTQDDNYTYQSFISSSSFTPYITTIGLYNDVGQLLAIGKVAQPIRKRNDVDLNFLVRIDLDRSIAFNSNRGLTK